MTTRDLRGRLARGAFAAALVAVVAGPAHAGGADQCADAIDLGTAIPTFRCNDVWYTDQPLGMATATASGAAAASCFSDGSVDNDRWYRWTNTTSDTVFIQVSTDEAANIGGDSQIAIFAGCGGAELACSDDDGVVDFRLSATGPVGVLAGQSVRIQLDGLLGNPAFDRVRFRCALPVRGETCKRPRPISPKCDGSWKVDEPLGMTVALPSGLAPASCHLDEVENDRWYSWLNDTGDSVGFEVSTDDLVNVGGDSQIAVYTACDAAREIICAEDEGLEDPLLAATGIFGVADGETLLMQFDGYDGDSAFERALFRCLPPSNGAGESCGRAIDLTTAIAGFACDDTWRMVEPLGMTTAASSWFPEASCFIDETEIDRWFRWTNTSGGYVRFEVSTDDPVNVGGDSQIAVFRDCHPDSEIACAEDGGINHRWLSNAGPFVVPPGGSIRIQIDGYEADTNFDRGLFRCAGFVATGEVCAVPTPLLSAIPSFSCDGGWYIAEPLGIATAYASGQPPASCFTDGVQGDRWFSWTNSGSARVRFEVSTDDPANIGSDPQIAVFAGCGAGSEITCSDDGGTIHPQLSTTEPVAVDAGATVRIQFDGFDGDRDFERGLFRCTPPPLAVGETCGNPVDLATAIPAFSCDSIWYFAAPLGIATAQPSGAPPASCIADGVDNDRWFRWTNTTGDPVRFDVSTDDPANVGGDSQIAVYGEDCAATSELGCANDGGLLDPALAVLLDTFIPNGETVFVQFDGEAADRGFDVAQFRCQRRTCTAPTGAVGNFLRAVDLADLDVELSWLGAEVVPPGYATFKTETKAELVETRAGIGDETLVGTTVGAYQVDPGVVPTAPALLFYEVVPTDNCGQPMLP